MNKKVILLIKLMKKSDEYWDITAEQCCIVINDQYLIYLITLFIKSVYIKNIITIKFYNLVLVLFIVQFQYIFFRLFCLN